MLSDVTLVDSDGRIDVVNPGTGEAFASAPDCTDALLDRAIEAGRRAFKGWRNTPIAQRQACLHKAADILTENRSEEHTSELQSLMRTSYADCCLKKKNDYFTTPPTMSYLDIHLYL